LDKHCITHFLNKTTAGSFKSLNNSPTYPNESNKFNTELAESILHDSVQENSELGRNQVRKERRKVTHHHTPPKKNLSRKTSTFTPCNSDKSVTINPPKFTKE